MDALSLLASYGDDDANTSSSDEDRNTLMKDSGIKRGGEINDSDDEEESDKDEEDDEEKAEAPVALPKSKLPSVDSMFSATTKPDFLKQVSSSEPDIVKPIKATTTIKEPNHYTGTYIPHERLRENVEARRREEMKRKQEKGDAEAQAKIKSEREAAMVEAATRKKRKADKGTAKDRVKTQRMSGQSGIGADFKVWRSEQEMVMRQGYD